MMNAKRLITLGLNREELIKTFEREGEALYQAWIDPDFLPKIMSYMQANS